MAIEKWKCVKLEYNSNMGMMCYGDERCISYIDKHNWIKVGDCVECERDEKGFYRRIWVNGILKTKDNFGDIHGRNNFMFANGQ